MYVDEVENVGEQLNVVMVLAELVMAVANAEISRFW